MNKNKEFYLEDYSLEDILKTTKGYYINYKEIEDNDTDMEEDKQEKQEISVNQDKPSFTMKPNYNSKGEKIVVFSINIPLNNKYKNGLKIDILINNEMYKNISKYFKK